MNDCKLLNIFELEDIVDDMSDNERGILFCFGTSFISKLIQAKTRLNVNELVPSHVALFSRDIIYESTTSEVCVNNKNIRQGVRRWLTQDFIKSEKNKLTKYVYIPHEWSQFIADKYVHLPYGKDTILDFLLKDGSDGTSKGLICSQYVNKCIVNPLNKLCPTPAEIFRVEKNRYNLFVYE